MTNITTCIFDFFGVLAQDDESILIRRIAPHCSHPAFAKTSLKGITSDPGLITGRIDLETMRQRLKHHLGLKMNHDAFDEAWREPYSRETPGILPLIEALAERCQLVLLTNVDGDYWKAVCCNYNVLRPFGTKLLSFEMGFAKPSREAYRRALEAAGESAAQCLFIDDTQQNVAVAAAMGMQTHLYRDVESLRADLTKLGLL